MAEQIVTPTSPPILFGRYRVLEQVGEWRLAAVYRATDERLQRQVLLHLLRKDLVGQESYRQRFIAEASTLRFSIAARLPIGHLWSPNILRVDPCGALAH
jgi:serine/threonine protein kinase